MFKHDGKMKKKKANTDSKRTVQRSEASEVIVTRS